MSLWLQPHSCDHSNRSLINKSQYQKTGEGVIVRVYGARFRQSLFCCVVDLGERDKVRGILVRVRRSAMGKEEFFWLLGGFWARFFPRVMSHHSLVGRFGWSVLYRPMSPRAKWVLNAEPLRVLAMFVAPHLRKILMTRFLREAMTRGPIPVLI